MLASLLKICAEDEFELHMVETRLNPFSESSGTWLPCVFSVAMPVHGGAFRASFQAKF